MKLTNITDLQQIISFCCPVYVRSYISIFPLKSCGIVEWIELIQDKIHSRLMFLRKLCFTPLKCNSVTQTWCLETVRGSFRMTQDTVSAQGGVVSEPLYVRYRLENSGTSLDSGNGSKSTTVLLAIRTVCSSSTIC
jgi:hypothetical protein